MEKKSVCLNRNEAEIIKKLKSRIIKLRSKPSTKNLEEVFDTLDFLDNKIASNIENVELIEKSRNLDEVLIKLSLNQEILWYYELLANNTTEFDDNNPKLNMSKKDLEKAQEIVRKFNIQEQNINEFTHGLLKGKDLVLRWILGDDWNEMHDSI